MLACGPAVGDAHTYVLGLIDGVGKRVKMCMLAFQGVFLGLIEKD